MVSVASLPYDVLVLILDNLSLPELSALHRAVAGNRTNIGTIATSYATRIIYQLVICGATFVQTTIKSNQKPCLYPHPTTPGRHFSSSREKDTRTYFLNYSPKLDTVDFKREFEQISAENFKMILVGKNIEPRPSYYPSVFGAEPVEPISLQVLFYPKHRSIMDGRMLELTFKIGEHSLSETVKDIYQTPLHQIRKVSQTLQLRSGVWIGKTDQRRTELPKCWCDILGDRINVSATLVKTFLEPNLSAEQQSVCPSALQAISISFPGISLPKSPRLLALLHLDHVDSEITKEDVFE
jgi:hypothetical protein